MRKAAWLLASLLSYACSGTSGGNVVGHFDEPHDAAADDSGGFGNAGPDSGGFCQLDGGSCGGPREVRSGKLDLLFVVDNSTSMQEEQDALRKQFPRLIEKLVTGDHDGDGEIDHQRIVDLHLAVVSSDAGGSGDICTPLGDDGRLRHEPNPAGDSTLSCKTSYPTFLTYENDAPSAEALAKDFGCIANLGTEGCGYEQHFESALKALWPATDSRLSFIGLGNTSTFGRGDTDNAGFLRANVQNAATLAIVVVADEDDCSVWDRRIFNFTATSDPNDPRVSHPTSLRCFDYPEALQPIERYLYGYRQLGAARVLFAGIVGVPPELVNEKARSQVRFRDAKSRNAFYDGILKDARMQEAIDPGDDTRLVAACESKLGRAAPARRFVSLAQKFGADALIQSICDDFGPPLDLVIENVTGPVE